MSDETELPDGWSLIAPVLKDTGKKQTVELKLTRPDGSQVAAHACIEFVGWKKSVCEFVHVLAHIEALFGRPEKDGLAYTDVEFSKEMLGAIDVEDDWEKEGEAWRTGESEEWKPK